MVPTYLDHEIKCTEMPITFPPQHQGVQPGLEYLMKPVPISDNTEGSGKLKGKIALITVETAGSDVGSQSDLQKKVRVLLSFSRLVNARMPN